MLCELNVTECHQNVTMNVTRLGVLTKTREAEEDEMVEETEGDGSVLKSHLFLHRAQVWSPASTSAVSRSPVTPAPGNLTSSSGLQGQVPDIDVNKNKNIFKIWQANNHYHKTSVHISESKKKNNRLQDRSTSEIKKGHLIIMKEALIR